MCRKVIVFSNDDCLLEPGLGDPLPAFHRYTISTPKFFAATYWTNNAVDWTCPRPLKEDLVVRGSIDDFSRSDKSSISSCFSGSRTERRFGRV